MSALAIYAAPDLYESHVYPHIDKWMQWHRRERREVSRLVALMRDARNTLSAHDFDLLMSCFRMDKSTTMRAAVARFEA